MSLVEIPESHRYLLEGAYYAVMTTIAPNGQPENTVVWFSWDGEDFIVNTAEGRRKDQNVRQNPKVALTVMDPENPYRWIDVRGEVAEIIVDEGYTNISAHAKIYRGVDEYYGGVLPIERKGSEVRLIYKIRPQRVLVYPHKH